MQIEITTDDNVRGGDDLIRHVATTVDAGLSRFRDRLTRVEVYLGDENAGKFGAADKRCTLEARPAGQRPLAVTDHAGSLEEACTGAVRKARRLLERRLGRLDNAKKGSASIRLSETE